jgi:hypothetical protein
MPAHRKTRKRSRKGIITIWHTKIKLNFPQSTTTKQEEGEIQKP